MPKEMQEYGAFYAKTHFSELLAGVAAGNRYMISKHGQAIAMLVPFVKESSEGGQNPIEGAICAIQKMRKGTTLGKGLSIREMKNQGRA